MVSLIGYLKWQWQLMKLRFQKEKYDFTNEFEILKGKVFQQMLKLL